jgi:hypothetical protein
MTVGRYGKIVKTDRVRSCFNPAQAMIDYQLLLIVYAMVDILSGETTRAPTLRQGYVSLCYI